MTKLAIQLAVLSSLLVGCGGGGSPADQQAFNLFESNLRVGMMRLRSQFTQLEPQTPERDAACRRLIFDIRALCEDDAQLQTLADAFADAIAQSDIFNMYDRNVLWLAGDLLREYPPENPAYLLALAGKVENARAPDAPAAYRTAYSAMAVGYLLETLTYPARVETYDDRVNGAEWELLRDWLAAHGSKLRYDPEIGKYHPTDLPRPRLITPPKPGDAETP